MEPYGHQGDPQADFFSGVHGRALEEGKPAAPDCARCHGAHGATPPGVGDIDKLCGQCHAASRAWFMRGPHRKAMAEAGLPECASCHHNHKTRPADIDALDQSCQTCHAADSAPIELVGRMKGLYLTARDDIERARATVRRAAAIPLNVEDYLARLEEARTSLLEVLPMVHAVDLDLIEGLTARARAIGHEVESEVADKLDERKWRRVGLGVFWFYLLLTVAILVGHRKRAVREVQGA
jgi:predicted CXXCH cytochrome family protein